MPGMMTIDSMDRGEQFGVTSCSSEGDKLQKPTEEIIQRIKKYVEQMEALPKGGSLKDQLITS